MKKFTFILLLFLLSCESINGGKTGEKEELIGNILITRLIWIMQLPKFIYSIEYSGSSEKKCENYYFHGLGIPDGVGTEKLVKCPKTSDIVGVCVTKSTNVVETLFYSDKYTTETAREVCLQITNKKVEFQTEYNPAADYSL